MQSILKRSTKLISRGFHIRILDSDWLEVITEYAYNIINANIDQSTKEMYNIIYDILTEES